MGSNRREVWKDPDAYIGKIIKYKYQAIGSKDAPRIPIFLGFRDERDMTND
jgi:DNA ligase-1